MAVIDAPPAPAAPTAPKMSSAERRQRLLARYRATRELSLALVEPLSPEDYRVQTMPDVSPPWWNLGHTSWFFARNILHPRGLYPDWFESFEYPLNSYYEGLGPRLPRNERGLATRPTTDDVLRYRREVDERMEGLILEGDEDDLKNLEFLVVTGIQHEQQHQELLMTEIQHILWRNPASLRTPYGAPPRPREADIPELEMVSFAGGLVTIGDQAGADGAWTWDNELPVHKAWLEPFELANRLVTNGEYLAFIEEGGYRDPLLWMSNGWAAVRAQGWEAPLYWERDSAAGAWHHWTLAGAEKLDPLEPVAHVSFYEADAFARWKSAQGGDFEGVRLPTEREWEHGAVTAGFDPGAANMLEDGTHHPVRAVRAGGSGRLLQTAGDLWEWTSSHYEPYPGYRPFDGDLMEYNGKFMDNQRVLRGGSVATPRDHIRASYRNFWPAGTRFQMTGIRLAR
jgi:ergothioneine biosynthesis protein EgtB